MGVSENRGPKYSTLNSRILFVRTPKSSTPNFRKLPYDVECIATPRASGLYDLAMIKPETLLS